MENSNPSMEKNPAESSTSAPSKKTSLAHTLRFRFEDELSSDEAESSTRSNTNGRESTTSDHDDHQSNQEILYEETITASDWPQMNYVLQRVLELRHPIFTNMVCSTLKGNYVNLSKQKFASHVVEKCLMTFGTEDVLEELVSFDKLWQIAGDQYENYVIKRALQIGKCCDDSLCICKAQIVISTKSSWSGSSKTWTNSELVME
ncbi:Putative pumilio-7-like protein [Morus notabilis]|uniref:Putative pumilio-7-like protein n=1 Tax=Morus notabilis TaxID=981085 RepID=W9R3G7_9ROSA|nr:Putative pumilio-7-like protein [Morus notabilis]